MICAASLSCSSCRRRTDGWYLIFGCEAKATTKDGGAREARVLHLALSRINADRAVVPLRARLYCQVQELLRDLDRRIRRSTDHPNGVDRMPSWLTIVADDNPSTLAAPSASVHGLPSPSTSEAYGGETQATRPSTTVAGTTETQPSMGAASTRDVAKPAASSTLRATSVLVGVPIAPSRNKYGLRTESIREVFAADRAPTPTRGSQQQRQQPQGLPFVREGAIEGSRYRTLSNQPTPALDVAVAFPQRKEVKVSEEDSGGTPGTDQPQEVVAGTELTGDEEYDML